MIWFSVCDVYSLTSIMFENAFFLFVNLCSDFEQTYEHCTSQNYSQNEKIMKMRGYVQIKIRSPSIFFLFLEKISNGVANFCKYKTKTCSLKYSKDIKKQQ